MAVAEAACSLLQASVFSILYTRQVYPAHLFEKKMVFGVPTPWPRAEPLVTYVKDAIQATTEWLNQVWLAAACIHCSIHSAACTSSRHTPFPSPPRVY